MVLDVPGLQHAASLGVVVGVNVTTSSSDCPFVFSMRACKCQLFTDESSRRLPKRLNYCFSVLASATN